MKKKENKDKPIDEFSDLDNFEKFQVGGFNEVIQTEWEQKAWLLSTKFVDKDVMQLHDLVLKELALTNIPDYELLYVYCVKMDVIEEWMSMGYSHLAKRMLTHMLFRLNLARSMEGKGEFYQHGRSASSMMLQPGMMSREEIMAMPQEEGMNGGRLAGGAGGIVSSIRGKMGRGKKHWWDD